MQQVVLIFRGTPRERISEGNSLLVCMEIVGSRVFGFFGKFFVCAAGETLSFCDEGVFFISEMCSCQIANFPGWAVASWHVLEVR